MFVRMFALFAIVAVAAVSIHAGQSAATTTEPFNPRVVRRITTDDVKLRVEAGEQMLVVDVRSSFTGPKIKNAAHVPLKKLAEWAKEVPRDALVVTYCTCGAEETSSVAVLKLQELGFTNAFALKGGLTAWRAAGLEAE